MSWPRHPWALGDALAKDIPPAEVALAGRTLRNEYGPAALEDVGKEMADAGTA